jgi:hypothetical protein
MKINQSYKCNTVTTWYHFLWMEREEERAVPVPLAVDVGMEVGEVRPHLVIRLVTSTTGLYVFGTVLRIRIQNRVFPDPKLIFLIA